MNKTLSFVKLDFLALKPYRRSLFYLVGLGLVLGVALKSVSTLSSMFMVGLLLVMSYPFAIAEKNSTDKLYSTLSLKRKDVVIGRYVFVMLAVLAGMLIVLCESVLISALFSLDMAINELLFTLCVLGFVISATASIQYPLFFKLGYTKAKVFTYLPLILVAVLIGILPSISETLPDFDWNTFFTSLSIKPLLMYGAPVVVSLALLAVSCAISCGLYEKRDL
jgi:hypothetical protein